MARGVNRVFELATLGSLGTPTALRLIYDASSEQTDLASLSFFGPASPNPMAV